jgi:hypothetical protein
MTPKVHFSSSLSFLRGAGALGAAALLVAGCVGAAASPAGPGASGSPAASISPSDQPASGFYLRAWQTQALAPQYVFGMLPGETIADGRYINGLVAIPMIYPGPVYAGLSARPISKNGTDTIVAEARADGLLTGKSDFTETPLPGSITVHIQMTVDGTTYDLTGPSTSRPAVQPVASPGTAAAFEAFWNRLSTIDTWLASDLGPSTPYLPATVAVMLTPPADAQLGFTPADVTWPLAGTFDEFGTAMSVTPYRCGLVSGADLATLLPVIQKANQLTRFVDSGGAKVSLQARVLLPGEPSPCG